MAPFKVQQRKTSSGRSALGMYAHTQPITSPWSSPLHFDQHLCIQTNNKRDGDDDGKHLRRRKSQAGRGQRGWPQTEQNLADHPLRTMQRLKKIRAACQARGGATDLRALTQACETPDNTRAHAQRATVDNA